MPVIYDVTPPTCESCEAQPAQTAVVFDDASLFFVCNECATALPDECEPIAYELTGIDRLAAKVNR